MTWHDRKTVVNILLADCARANIIRLIMSLFGLVYSVNKNISYRKLKKLFEEVRV
jgi:hypothetical protein